jgi:hypothetical protein
MAGFGTLHEVKHQWTIEDLWDAHEACDIKEEAQAYQEEQFERT